MARIVVLLRNGIGLFVVMSPIIPQDVASCGLQGGAAMCDAELEISLFDPERRFYNSDDAAAYLSGAVFVARRVPCASGRWKGRSRAPNSVTCGTIRALNLTGSWTGLR